MQSLVVASDNSCVKETGIILLMHPANEIWRYNVTSSLIGWPHAENDSGRLLLFGAKTAEVPSVGQNA